jgi:uncharacterized membrane protein
MLLSTFLNILGASIGAMSAMFFAVGALFLSKKNIYEITSMKWDVHQEWADSIADQRADYIVGALLLVLSFLSQIAANLAPPTSAPSLLQPFGYAIAEIVAVVAVLLVCSLLFRRVNANATKEALRKWRAAELATLGPETKNDAPSPNP